MFSNLRDEIRQEILGVILVAFTVLVYVGLFSPTTGGFGEIVRRVLSACFGDAQFYVPALVGAAGLLCIFKLGKLFGGVRSAGWVLGLLVALGWLHRFNLAYDGLEFNGIQFGWGGGLIGAGVTWSLRELLGPVGRDVALSALTLIAFLLATDISLVHFVGRTGETTWSLGRWLGRSAGRLVRGRGSAAKAARQAAPEKYDPRGFGSRPGPSAGPTPAGRPLSRDAGATPAGQVVQMGRRSGPAFGPQAIAAVSQTGRGLAPDESGAGLPRAAGQPATPTTTTGSGPVARQVPAPRPGAARKPYEQIALSEDVLYELPPLGLLDPPNPAKVRKVRQDVDEKARILEETLASFGVGGKVTGARRGPVVTRFEFEPAQGVKVARITSLSDDIALHLASEGVRIEAPIPGKHAVGIEVPNLEVSTVPLREVLEDPEVASAPSKLAVAFGKDITGRPITGNLDRLLHILIAGATGSGKSVCINAMLASLLLRAKPNEVKLLLIDPKVVELSVYEGIPHLVAPVVTDPKKAAGCLRWAVKQMEERYELFAATGVRDIGGYNSMVTEAAQAAATREADRTRPAPAPWVRETGVGGGPAGRPAGPGSAPPAHTVTAAGTALGLAEAAEMDRDVRGPAGPQPLPYIVVVIDELADLMRVAPVDVEDAIWRLAQMARAAGIHLVVATQRPSVDVITGTIKANIPTRVAFAVSSQVDSRTIIDVAGAEKLVGHGDMLYMPVGMTKPLRVQGAYVSVREIEALVEYAKNQGRPKYAPDVLTTEEAPDKEEEQGNDALFDDAVRVVMETGQASISMLQRKLRVGYTRAGRLIDMMEERGIVGPFEGSKAREIIMTYDQYRRSKEAARRALEPRETASGGTPRLTLGSGAPRRLEAGRGDEDEPG